MPIDFSETSVLALEHAAAFCQKFKSKLHLLHVYKGSEIDILPDVYSPHIDQVAVKKGVVELLQKQANSFASKYGIDAEVELREGSVTKEITASAKESNADMIVLGTHGVSGFEEFFLGSNAYKVVTSSQLPVLTIQKHSKSIDYKNIVIGIDSTSHTRDKVSHVATIAEAFGSTVHVVALVTDEHEEESAIFNLKMKQINEYLDHRNVKYVNETIHGHDIADMLMKKAKSVNADLIAIMTEQEASTGLFVGPYAQRIVNHSKIPVLSITPFDIVDKFSQDDLAGAYRPFS